MSTACCMAMEQQLDFECSTHPGPYDCPDAVVVKAGALIGLPIHDGGSSYILIHFCPWCGKRLRDE